MAPPRPPENPEKPLGAGPKRGIPLGPTDKRLQKWMYFRLGESLTSHLTTQVDTL